MVIKLIEAGINGGNSEPNRKSHLAPNYEYEKESMTKRRNV